MLANLRRPRLVLAQEPDLLRVERAIQPPVFGARLVELGEEDRHVAERRRVNARPSQRRLSASLACGLAPRRAGAPAQLERAVDGYELHAGRLDPLADRVVVLAARVVELSALNVDRPAGEEVVAAAALLQDTG